MPAFSARVTALSRRRNFPASATDEATTGEAGDIDARSASIVFDTQVALLAPRKMATVRLDVGSSLATWQNGTRVLMPNLNVAY